MIDNRDLFDLLLAANNIEEFANNAGLSFDSARIFIEKILDKCKFLLKDNEDHETSKILNQ